MANQTDKLQGAVVIRYERHSHGVVELLTYQMRHRLDLIYYTHPYEIEVARGYGFVIVLSPEDLEGVVKAYNARQHRLPLIVHIDVPEVIDRLDYESHFPGVEVLPVPQADLASDPRVTLRITLFRDIIKQLDALRYSF